MNQYKKALEGSKTLDFELANNFAIIEPMILEEYKNGGKNLVINYSLQESIFGSYIVASTNKGICNILFCDDLELGLSDLRSRWCNAKLVEQKDKFHEQVIDYFYSLNTSSQKIPLDSEKWWSGSPRLEPRHDRGVNKVDGVLFEESQTTNYKQHKLKLNIHGTHFQIKVWQALLLIPFGSIITYGLIASFINHPKSSRAVGTAIGNNPIGFIIPCHRVVASTGAISGYRWGINRKKAILAWEYSHKIKLD